MDLTEAKSRLAEDGFCILEGLIAPEEAERLDALARPLMTHQTGYVKLEGALNRLVLHGSIVGKRTITEEMAQAVLRDMLDHGEAVITVGHWLRSGATRARQARGERPDCHATHRPPEALPSQRSVTAIFGTAKYRA